MMRLFDNRDLLSCSVSILLIKGELYMKFLLRLYAAVVLFPLSIIADDAVKDFQIFTMSVEQGLEEIKRNSYEVENRVNEMEKVSSVYSPNLYSRFESFRVKNYDDFSENDVTVMGMRSNVGIEKLFRTGTQVAAEVSLDVNNYRADVSSLRYNEESYEFTSVKEEHKLSTLIPELNIKLSQPLLKNRGGVSEKFTVENARVQSIAAALNGELDNNNSVCRYQLDYFSLYQLHSDTLFLKQMLEKLKKHESRALSLLNEGLIEDDEYAQYSVFTLQIEELIYSSSAEISSLTEVLNPYLPADSCCSDNFELLYKHYSSEVVTPQPFDSTIQGRLYTLLSKNAHDYIELRRKLINPELNVFGEGGFKNYSNYRKEPSRKKRNDFNVDLTLGVQFSMPLGNVKVKSELKEAEIYLSKLSCESAIARRDYNTNIKRLKTFIENGKILVDKKTEVIKKLREKAAFEKKKFNQARLDLSELIDTQSQIVEEIVALNRIKNNVIKTVFEFKTLIK